MFIKKLFKVYKPIEELMYVSVEVLRERLKGKDNSQLVFELIDRTNCNQYAPEGFFSAGSFIQERAIIVGAKLNGCPAGYGVGVLKGGRGAYFKVKYSDLCFEAKRTVSFIKKWKFKIPYYGI